MIDQFINVSFKGYKAYLLVHYSSGAISAASKHITTVCTSPPYTVTSHSPPHSLECVYKVCNSFKSPKLWKSS